MIQLPFSGSLCNTIFDLFRNLFLDVVKGHRKLVRESSGLYLYVNQLHSPHSSRYLSGRVGAKVLVCAGRDFTDNLEAVGEIQKNVTLSHQPRANLEHSF